MTFSEARFRPSLEERLESIISGAALMADSSCTRDDRRERIVAECNAVRQALQDLLSEYMNNVSAGLQAFLISMVCALCSCDEIRHSRNRGQISPKEHFGSKPVLWLFPCACSRRKNWVKCKISENLRVTWVVSSWSFWWLWFDLSRSSVGEGDDGWKQGRLCHRVLSEAKNSNRC